MCYIGNELQSRMSLLGIAVEDLAGKAFMDVDNINGIVNNEVALEEIDEFDLSLICSVLHCQPEYFFDENVRNRDLLVSTMNRGKDNNKSMNVKAKLQDFISDFAFLNDVLAEVE